MTPTTLTDMTAAPPAPVEAPPAPELTEAEKVAAEKRLRAMALLRSWRNATGEEAEEMRETGEYLIAALNASRAEVGARLHFPPELKGKTW